MTGKVHSLETFGLADGPGVRFVVFMQGCRMRCRYCHNPETWKQDGGTEYTAKKLFDRAYRYRTYWKENGGITVSGGEPLLQMEFVTEFFSLAKEKGISTALDTSGNPFTKEKMFLEKFDRLLDVTDLVLLDMKEMKKDKHEELTGFTNENIKEMAEYLSEHGKDMWVRHVLVPGLTDDEDGLYELRNFLHTLKTVKRVEVLPYHTLGLLKWEALKLPYPLEGVRVPTKEEVKRAEEILTGSKKSPIVLPTAETN
jgi:pyruvate formate lyase activating enzyme